LDGVPVTAGAAAEEALLDEEADVGEVTGGGAEGFTPGGDGLEGRALVDDAEDAEAGDEAAGLAEEEVSAGLEKEILRMAFMKTTADGDGGGGWEGRRGKRMF